MSKILEKLIARNNAILEKMEAHDKTAHGGLPLSQSGLRRGCKRCEFLIADEEQRKRAAGSKDVV